MRNCSQYVDAIKVHFYNCNIILDKVNKFIGVT